MSLLCPRAWIPFVEYLTYFISEPARLWTWLSVGGLASWVSNSSPCKEESFSLHMAFRRGPLTGCLSTEGTATLNSKWEETGTQSNPRREISWGGGAQPFKQIHRRPSGRLIAFACRWFPSGLSFYLKILYLVLWNLFYFFLELWFLLTHRGHVHCTIKNKNRRLDAKVKSASNTPSIYYFVKPTDPSVNPPWGLVPAI